MYIGKRWFVSVMPGWGWDLGSEHEYWTRWIIGPFWALHYRTQHDYDYDSYDYGDS